MSTPPPATREEVLRAFADANARPMTAGELATEIDGNRAAASGPRLIDRYVKPVLAEMVREQTVVSVVGDAVRLIGPRTSNIRRGATYYATARMAAEHKANMERAAALERAGRDLAAKVAAVAGDRIVDVAGTADGGVTVTFTFAQAHTMFDLGDPLDAAEDPATDHSDGATGTDQAGDTGDDDTGAADGEPLPQSANCRLCDTLVHYDASFDAYVDDTKDPFCPNGLQHELPAGFTDSAPRDGKPATPWLTRDSGV